MDGGKKMKKLFPITLATLASTGFVVYKYKKAKQQKIESSFKELVDMSKDYDDTTKFILINDFYRKHSKYSSKYLDSLFVKYLEQN